MDLQNIFASILNRSLTGSIVIACVLLARLALKKAPRVFSWALWLVVLLRLLCPVSIPGPVSVLELLDAPHTPSGAVEFLEPPVQAPLETIRPVDEGQTVQSIPIPTKPPIDWNFLGSRVWLLGAVSLLTYGIFSYVNLRRKLRESIPLGRGIREADGISSAFVLMHTIYLPTDLEPEERKYILLHEQLHLRHGDPIVKTLFWLAVCIHWFNPLVWLSFFLCDRDMELRCDEAVLKRLGPQVRSDYAQSLLNFATGRSRLAAPLAFGEGDTGKRVKFVLSWRRTKVWMAAAGGLLCAAVLLLTACDPRTDSPFGHSYRVSGIVAQADAQIEFDGSTLFTLTSDSALIVRRNGQTVMYGSLKKAPYDPEALRATTWKTQDGEWQLLKWEDGTLHLRSGDGTVLELARTDLLGVSIKQPGIESYVEPVWYSTGTWDWLPEEMSVTLVDGDAQIVLMPELDVDILQVTEEYYESSPDGTIIISSDYTLQPDKNGDFLLNVSRRGKDADDLAVYHVTVGQDSFVFKLAFPAVPGETSFSVDLEEQTHPVTYSENGAFITLWLPESWAYAVTSVDDDAYNAGIAGGITLWPRGREEGKLFFGYYPDLFAVCGTGLETTELVLAGKPASVGTYDDRPLWDFISFDDHFSVWGQNHDAWWAEYGDQAMEILNTAQFGTE